MARIQFASFTLTEQTDRVPHKVTDAEREARTRFEAKCAAAARRGDWFGARDPRQIRDWDDRPTSYLVFQLGRQGIELLIAG